MCLERGASLPGLLVGLALGSSALLMALERFQTLGLGVWLLREPLMLRQQAREALFELAADMRRHGQAGCTGLAVTDASGSDVLFEYMAPGWNIVHAESDAERRSLQALQIAVPGSDAETASRGTLVLSSCQGTERVSLAPGHHWQRQSAGVWRLSLPDTVDNGEPPVHHLPSLTIGPLVQRRYRLQRSALGDGVLLRSETGHADQQLLTQVHAFSVQPEGASATRILLHFGREEAPWQLTVAHRQPGMALIMVMVLILAAAELMALGQRLLLDEIRSQQRHEAWWQTLQYAEYTLRHAEHRVARDLKLPLSVQRFAADCRHPEPGFCASTAFGRRQAPWQQPQMLTPCQDAACIEVTLPHQKAPQRSLVGARRRGKTLPTQPLANERPNHCPQNPLHGPFNAHPCYLVELLDADYQSGALLRITVRAWGYTPRSQVTLQSYYRIGSSPLRLSWLSLP